MSSLDYAVTHHLDTPYQGTRLAEYLALGPGLRELGFPKPPHGLLVGVSATGQLYQVVFRGEGQWPGLSVQGSIFGGAPVCAGYLRKLQSGGVDALLSSRRPQGEPVRRALVYTRLEGEFLKLLEKAELGGKKLHKQTIGWR